MSDLASAGESSTVAPSAQKADRKRTLVACNRCRRRRQKCDARIPSCSACLKTNSKCVVEDVYSSRAYPRGYVAALEARIQQLEESLYTFRPEASAGPLQLVRGAYASENDQEYGPGLSSASILPDSMQNSMLEDVEGLQRDTQTASRTGSDDYDGLADSVGLLALSASDEPRYVGASSGYTFAKVLTSTFNAELPSLRHRIFFSSGPYDTTHERIRFDDIEPASIPPVSLAERLTRVFFGHMSWQYPLVSSGTFATYLSRVMQEKTAAPEIMLYFAHMIWAIGARLSEATYGYSERYAAKAFYKAALQHCDSVFELDDYRCVQGLFLQAIYALQNHAGTSLWRLVGLSMTVAVEQGLHRNLEDRMIKQGKSLAEVEMRSRIFWSIYALDRSDALFLGRPHRISDDEIDVSLPRDLVETDAHGTLSEARSPTGLTMVIHLFKIRQIQSRIQKFCCAIHRADSASRMLQKRQLRHDLDQWLRDRPVLPADHQLLGSPMEYHDLLYYNSLFILHRTALHQPDICEDGVELLCACDAASHILEYFQLMHRRNELQYTYYTMHHCFGAGITLLFCIWSARARSFETMTDLSARIRNCSALLSVVAQVFSQARPFRDTFETLATAVLTQVAAKMPLRTPLEQLDLSEPYGLNASMPAVVDGDTDLAYLDMINEILGQSGRYTQSFGYAQTP